jgi:cytochrome c-type biogenesis protein CcmH/NrfG
MLAARSICRTRFPDGNLVGGLRLRAMVWKQRCDLAKLRPICWAMRLTILSVGMVVAAGPLCRGVRGQQSGDKSWTESITSPVKQGFDKLGNALSPKATPVAITDDDPISLKSNAKPGPKLYVALARLYEQAGKLNEAEQQYQMALREKPDDLPALLCYAQLKERLDKPNDAMQLYSRAAAMHPKQASVYNHLGLHYARQKRLDEAAATLNQAIQLEPKNPLYRNNMAAVLVDQGKVREAFGHLQAVHGEAAAHYNLGYLLTKKNEPQAALQHFTLALRADPSLTAAQQWMNYLKQPAAQARLATTPAVVGVKVLPGDRSMRPADDAPMPPEGALPQRLPPTTLQQPGSDGPTLPGISYDRRVMPGMSLPPEPPATAVRPLPRVN